MTSLWCHQMCMNGKVNQGPLFDINVWCNRSWKTKLHSMIVRQYSHLKKKKKKKKAGRHAWKMFQTIKTCTKISVNKKLKNKIYVITMHL